MEIKMEVGTVHEINVTVQDNMTAASMKSGNLDVLATPYMIALMEQASAELCQKFLPEGYPYDSQTEEVIIPMQTCRDNGKYSAFCSNKPWCTRSRSCNSQ